MISAKAGGNSAEAKKEAHDENRTNDTQGQPTTAFTQIRRYGTNRKGGDEMNGETMNMWDDPAVIKAASEAMMELAKCAYLQKFQPSCLWITQRCGAIQRVLTIATVVVESLCGTDKKGGAA